MTNRDNRFVWFWLGALAAIVTSISVTSSTARIQDQQGGAPSTHAPTQEEMNAADTEPNQWLTSNKGYLGFRYSKLSQISPQNIRSLKAVCSFKLGEQAGAVDGGVITYEAKGRQFIAVAAGDNNPTYKAKGENTIVILGLP
jgi:glucose dehydrogenase